MSGDTRTLCDPDRQQMAQHDLRHALFTLRTGIELLGHVRDDLEKFSEVQQLLQEEVSKAAQLIDKLLPRTQAADPDRDQSAP